MGPECGVGVVFARGGQVDAAFPVGIWTIPEIGYYGLTQKQAIAAGYDAEVGVATYDRCLRGRVFAPDGMLKLVFDRTDARILGVHIIGATLAHSKRGARICHRARAFTSGALPRACTAPFASSCQAPMRASWCIMGWTSWRRRRRSSTWRRPSSPQSPTTLFKEAALNGNEKLDFGIQWQELLAQLNTAMAAGGRDGALDEAKLRQRFDEIDVNGNGEIDEEELRAVFVKLGLDGLQPSVIPNLIRLTDDDGKETIGWPEFLKVFKVLERIEQTQKEKKDRGFF